MVDSYFSKPRLRFSILGYPSVIKKRKGAIIKRKVRLALIPTKKFSVDYRVIIEDNYIVNNGMGDMIIGDKSSITSKVKLVDQ
jgi:hypothetical protein